MVGMAVLYRSLVAAALPAALTVALSAAPVHAQAPTQTDEQLLKEKCTLCHSAHRIYRLDLNEVVPVLERMRKMNPDWVTKEESDHIARVIAKLLQDPSAMATRTAWDESVERGEKLFKDTGLGTAGKSCSSCHEPAQLRHVEDAYPKFNAALKRYVSLDEAINLMIKEKLKGTPLPPNDQRYFDLLAYLKSIK